MSGLPKRWLKVQFTDSVSRFEQAVCKISTLHPKFRTADDTG
jgi:hypothetical protein